MRTVVYALFGASFTIATAWALGSLLLRKFSLSLNRLEERLLAIITGSACLSAIVFALCTAGLARKGTYLVLGLVSIVLAIRFGSQAEPEAPGPGWWTLPFAVLTAVSVFRVNPDVTHLSIVDQAHGFQSAAALRDGIQMLLLPAFALGRQAAAALVDVALLAALALLMLCYGRRVGHPIAGMISAILLYVCPLANIEVATAAVPFALFYLLQFWLWAEQPLADARGSVEGDGTATVRERMLPVPIGILAFIIWKLRQQRKPVLGPALAVSIPALAFLWMARPVSPVITGTWFSVLNRWELLGLVIVGTSLALLALRLPPGRQLLLAAAVFALHPANAAPFALLALGMAFSDKPWATVHRAASAALRLLRTIFKMPTLAEPIAIPTPWFIRAAGGAFVVAYFVFFAWDGLHAHFIHDDPANIAYYWSRGTWPLIRAQFEFFSTYIRPMGGLFYLPIYHFAGFNPVPYRAVALLIILLNTVLFYRVARLISGSERIAWLAAILVSYHAHLMDMIYQNSNIYDVLCFLFYFAALALYLGIRARGQFPNWRETTGIAALYVCALDSKEMAVTLPVTLALFELLFHPPAGIVPKTILAWLKREGRVTCIAGLLTAVYISGKTFGPDPLIALDAYRPEFTLRKFMSSITWNIQSLFYLPEWFGPGYVAAACVALLAFAWVKRNRYVAFCVLFATLSELPIVFLGRPGPSLYIPLAAWAMLVSAATWASAQLIASVFRHRAVRLVTTGLLVAVFLFSNAGWTWEVTQVLRPFFYQGQAKVWSAIQQFAKFQINPKPGARIAFLHDPLPVPTTMYLAQLRFNDPSLVVFLNPTPLLDLATVDYIFDYRDGQFIQIKLEP